MIVIACVDNRFGMMFNSRRVSQDSFLRHEIIKRTNGVTLWMNAYSKKQFEDCEEQIKVDEDFLKKAKIGEYCFVENLSLKEYEKKIEKVILCKWNRDYPSDFKFDIDLSNDKWIFTSMDEIKGLSHDRITIEEYMQ